MILRECKNDIIVDHNSSNPRSNRLASTSDDVIAIGPSKSSRSYSKQNGPPSVIDIDEAESDEDQKNAS